MCVWKEAYHPTASAPFLAHNFLILEAPPLYVFHRILDWIRIGPRISRVAQVHVTRIVESYDLSKPRWCYGFETWRLEDRWKFIFQRRLEFGEARHFVVRGTPGNYERPWYLPRSSSDLLGMYSSDLLGLIFSVSRSWPVGTTDLLLDLRIFLTRFQRRYPDCLLKRVQDLVVETLH